jgi:hypothetical protein
LLSKYRMKEDWLLQMLVLEMDYAWTWVMAAWACSHTDCCALLLLDKFAAAHRQVTRISKQFCNQSIYHTDFLSLPFDNPFLWVQLTMEDLAQQDQLSKAGWASERVCKISHMLIPWNLSYTKYVRGHYTMMSGLLLLWFNKDK